MDVHKLSQILLRTSTEFAESVSDFNGTLRYIPAIGAMIKKRSTPPRNVKRMERYLLLLRSVFTENLYRGFLANGFRSDGSLS